MNIVMIHSNYRATKSDRHEHLYVFLCLHDHPCKANIHGLLASGCSPWRSHSDAMFRGHEHGTWHKTGRAVEAWERCSPGRSSLVSWGAEGPLYIV